MTCLAPTNETPFHNENKFFPNMNERYNQWVPRKPIMEDFSSDEEAHLSIQDKQSLDRLKDIDFHDLSMRATLLNAEYRYAQDESMTPNNRKRLFSEYNNSPDFRNTEDGRYKLTLSQFATSASEQEPLQYAGGEDEDVEEILMRLRHGHDFYQPKAGTPPPSLPNILFNPHAMGRPPFPYESLPPCPPVTPSPNKGSLFHILSQEPSANGEHVTLPHPHPHAAYSHASYPQSVYNANLHHPMRKMFFDEAYGDGEEMGLEHPKKKQRRDGHPKPHSHSHHGNKSPMKSIIVSNEDGCVEKENIAAGLCFKTHKPKVQREYYYAKLSKTIFRWTCCGSQAKTHPDA